MSGGRWELARNLRAAYFRVAGFWTKASWLCMLAVLLCGLDGLWLSYSRLQQIHTTDLVAGDSVDSGLIVAGLQRVRGLPDVLAWWYGPWVVGPTNAFYRPLTSTIWFVEYRIFGVQGFRAFELVHFLSHLLTLLVLWGFLRELLGLRIATIASCCFAVSFSMRLFGFPGVMYALPLWKDSPELWFSTAALLCLWGYLRFLRRAERRYFVGAAVAFVIGVLVKEAAYVVPLLLALLLWHEGKLATRWKTLLPFFALAAALLAFRCWALQGSGFRFGSNGSWKQRWFDNVIGGAPGALLTLHDWMPFAIVGAALGLYALRQRAWPTALGGAFVTVACLVASARDWSDPEIAFYLPLFGSTRQWTEATLALALLAAYWRFARTRRRGQVVGWLWVVIAYLPLMTAPITGHALYFVSIGWNLWLAYSLIDVAQELTAWGRSLMAWGRELKPAVEASES